MKNQAHYEVFGLDEERNRKEHDLRLRVKDAEGEQQPEDGAGRAYCRDDRAHS